MTEFLFKHESLC